MARAPKHKSISLSAGAQCAPLRGKTRTEAVGSPIGVFLYINEYTIIQKDAKNRQLVTANSSFLLKFLFFTPDYPFFTLFCGGCHLYIQR